MGLLTAHAAQHIQQFQLLKEGDCTHERDTWTGRKTHIYVVADIADHWIGRAVPEQVLNR